MSVLYPLQSVVQSYDWGSTTALAQLTGRPHPTSTPEAELWMGAHPRGPSRLADGRSLIELLQSDPEQSLGAVVLARFGERLPFLFKVLAAARPLSLQVHPSHEQARAGYQREQAAGLALTDRVRCYQDESHKPELICALTPFAALCGFREPRATLQLFDALGVGPEDPVDDAWRATLRALAIDGGLEAAYRDLFGLNPTALQGLVERALSRVSGLPGRWQRTSEARLMARWLPEIAQLYPGDRGILGALFLNLLELEPGEALYLPSGNLHAYLSGTALELMASSDNVLRGGLTSKHVDVPELLKVVTFEASAPERLLGEPGSGSRTRSGAGDERVYRTPAEEFCLSLLTLEAGAHTLVGEGPEIVLCLEGRVQIASNDDRHVLAPGESMFIAAAARDRVAQGPGRLARARLAL